MGSEQKSPVHDEVERAGTRGREVGHEGGREFELHPLHQTTGNSSPKSRSAGNAIVTGFQ